jgi:hypothetical protein
MVTEPFPLRAAQGNAILRTGGASNAKRTPSGVLFALRRIDKKDAVI